MKEPPIATAESSAATVMDRTMKLSIAGAKLLTF